MMRERMKAGPSSVADISKALIAGNGAGLTRYRAHQLEADVIKVGPGDVYVGHGTEIIRTTLGSCITVCMYAPSLRMGGMNHFLLGGDGGASNRGSTRYGWGAMQRLHALMIAYGASRKELQLKLFGGGAMFGEQGQTGVQNLSFLREYIAEHGLNVVAEDVGGDTVRQLLFFAGTGHVRLHRSRADALAS